MSHAAALQEAAQHLLGALGINDTHKTAATTCQMLKDYINKACSMATKLGIMEALPGQGNKAPSTLPQTQSNVPVGRAFSRIKEVLPADVAYEEGPTVADVEQALRRFELDSFLAPSHLIPQAVSPMQMPQDLQAMNMAEPQLEDVIMVDVDTEEAEVPEVNQIAAGNASTNVNSTPAVADFFVASPPPLLNATRHHHYLPHRRSQPAALGNDASSICHRYAALQDFVAMFNGPLPQEIIAALSEMFNIGNDDDADDLDQALAGLVNEGIAELQEDAHEVQAQATAAQLAFFR
ncbi:unnamed protein product [Urochloa decumbens]|uniref:Uncharacterized protein n=1 Tax=Urochloa decumbens TaxID=240449 RepID=A0ABC8YUX6_9POAL